VKTLQVSKFKAKCLGLLKEIHDTGEPLAVTLRGQTLAIVQAPGIFDPQGKRSVSETLDKLLPLLRIEEEEFVPPSRLDRETAKNPFPRADLC